MTIDVTALEMLPAETNGLRPCGQILTCLWTCWPGQTCTNTCTVTEWSE